MTDLWTAQDVRSALSVGQFQGNPHWQGTSICIDTRTVRAGDIFLGLQGPYNNGSTWGHEAVMRGAAAIIVDDSFVFNPSAFADSCGVVVVPDTLAALNELAKFARARTAASVVGVTGSFGKTTVKDALHLILSHEGTTTASTRSFNNHWGVPLTLCQTPPSCDFAVIEMGMNHAGEIAHLSAIARPHVALITTIQGMHLENLGSIEGVCEAKCEIFHGMKPGSCAILNRDDAMYPRARTKAQERGLHCVSFSTKDSTSDIFLESVTPSPQGFTVTARVMGRLISYFLPGLADHFVMNSLGIAGVLSVLGADVPAGMGHLKHFVLPEGRGRVHTRPYKDGVIHVIDDSYNAGPESMMAALQVLAKLAGQTGGRAIAILGDMGELGPKKIDIHRAFKPLILALNIDKVYTSGPLMAALFSDLPVDNQGAHNDDVSGLMPQILGDVRAGDVYLIKGSKGQYAARGRMSVALDQLLTVSWQEGIIS